MLPANVRLGRKGIARYKHSSLIALNVSDNEKSFIALTPGDDAIKLFTFVI